MVTAKTKILKHLWEQGGGYINTCDNLSLITKISLTDANIFVDISSLSIEKTLYKGNNVAVVRGLIAEQNRICLHNILTGVSIDNNFYIPVNSRYTITKLTNGNVRYNYMFALSEQYIEDNKRKSNNRYQ